MNPVFRSHLFTDKETAIELSNSFTKQYHEYNTVLQDAVTKKYFVTNEFDSNTGITNGNFRGPRYKHQALRY